jgi:hypothetical protein
VRIGSRPGTQGGQGNALAGAFGLWKLEPRIKKTGGGRMRSDAVYRLVTEMSDLQKLSLLQLLKLGAASPDVRSVVMECRDRGLDLDATLAEVLRRFADRVAIRVHH